MACAGACIPLARLAGVVALSFFDRVTSVAAGWCRSGCAAGAIDGVPRAFTLKALSLHGIVAAVRSVRKTGSGGVMACAGACIPLARLAGVAALSFFDRVTSVAAVRSLGLSAVRSLGPSAITRILGLSTIGRRSLSTIGRRTIGRRSTIGRKSTSTIGRRLGLSTIGRILSLSTIGRRLGTIISAVGRRLGSTSSAIGRRLGSVGTIIRRRTISSLVGRMRSRGLGRGAFARCCVPSAVFLGTRQLRLGVASYRRPLCSSVSRFRAFDGSPVVDITFHPR
jgi:hypothetical protein